MTIITELPGKTLNCPGQISTLAGPITRYRPANALPARQETMIGLKAKSMKGTSLY